MGRPSKFENIEQELEQRIARGIYAEGHPLPSEHKLARGFNVSRGTIRKALHGLRMKERILVAHGKGSFADGTRARSRFPVVDRSFGLVAPINFADWKLSHYSCFLHLLFEERANREGCRMIHFQPEALEEEERFLAEMEQGSLKRLAIDESSLFQRSISPVLFKRLLQAGKRIVSFFYEEISACSRATGLEFTDRVFTDWSVGAAEATRHLLDQGCRQPVFAGFDGVEWSDARKRAFLGVLHERGLWKMGDPAPSVSYPKPVQWERDKLPVDLYPVGAKNLLQYLEAHAVDAVLCANDALIQELTRQRPLAQLPPLVGFDDSMWARENGIPSVAMNVRQLADTLFDCLQMPLANHLRVFRVPTRLARRENGSKSVLAEPQPILVSP